MGRREWQTGDRLIRKDYPLIGVLKLFENNKNSLVVHQEGLPAIGVLKLFLTGRRLLT